jgi:hypothetical protein
MNLFLLFFFSKKKIEENVHNLFSDVNEKQEEENIKNRIKQNDEINDVF